MQEALFLWPSGWAERLKFSTILLKAWFTLSLGLMGVCEGSFWTRAIQVGGSSTAALMNTGGNGIGLLAPALTPVISAYLGWKWGIGLGCLVAIVGGLCWFAIRHRTDYKPS